MLEIKQQKNIRSQNFIASLSSIALLLSVTNLICQPASLADSRSATSTKVVSSHPNALARLHTPHRSSTGIATLRLYTKVSDLKSDSLIRNLLKSAVSADSPDNNPDANIKEAAALNLNINETLAANLFRQEKFDLNELENIDKENLVLGNLTRDNAVHLAKGNALFEPSKNIVVLIDFAEIHIAGGSLVGVLRPNADIVSIYDLEDGGSNKVRIQIGKESLSLSPGKNMIICKEPDEFEKINPVHHIAYRRPEGRKLQSGYYAYTSEFSISSAILHVKPLQNILLSSDPLDQKIANRLIKNYVILEDVFGNNEPFKMPANIVAPVKISSNSP